MKILVADDDIRMRQLLIKILEPLSNEIFQCENGLEAVQKNKEITPDIILMDVKMQKMDGLSATELIRKSNPATIIIIVTDYDDEKLKTKALNCGANNYVLKENIFEVLNIIRNYKI